jgi:hypothetical protein
MISFREGGDPFFLTQMETKKVRDDTDADMFHISLFSFFYFFGRQAGRQVYLGGCLEDLYPVRTNLFMRLSSFLLFLILKGELDDGRGW